MKLTPEQLKQAAEECGIGWASGLGGMDEFLSAFAKKVIELNKPEETCFYVRHIKDQTAWSPKGTQRGAPHLFTTFGKADGRRKTLWRPHEYEVVEVQLIEITKDIQA